MEKQLQVLSTKQILELNTQPSWCTCAWQIRYALKHTRTAPHTSTSNTAAWDA